MDDITKASDKICEYVQGIGKCRDSECDKCLYDNVKEIFEYMQKIMDEYF